MRVARRWVEDVLWRLQHWGAEEWRTGSLGHGTMRQYIKKGALLHAPLRLNRRDEATRTPDPYVPNVVRYQLRYIPINLCFVDAKVVVFLWTDEFFRGKVWWCGRICIPLQPQIAKKRCHSSVGRAKDWKSLCPRFDSWWYHFLLSLRRFTYFMGKRLFSFLVGNVGGADIKKVAMRWAFLLHSSLLLVERQRRCCAVYK